MKKILILFLICIPVLIACDDKEAGEKITVPDQQELTQSAYADDETSGTVTFTATASWTAEVRKTAQAGDTRAEGVEWLTLDQYEGKAGEHTLSIKLAPNYTGKSRTGSIYISSGKDEVTVDVTQQATAEDGYIPEDPALTATVFAAGLCRNSGGLNKATLWKYTDGQSPSMITLRSGGENSVAYGVCTWNGNVYAVGMGAPTGTYDNAALMWKYSEGGNVEEIILPNGSSANDICVWNDALWIGGNFWDDKNTAVLWKYKADGTIERTVMPKEADHSYINGVHATPDALYCVGFSSSDGKNSSATTWRYTEGAAIEKSVSSLPSSTTYAHAVTVTGGKVWTVGRERDKTTLHTTISMWIDGNASLVLTGDPRYTSQATDVCTYNKAIYGCYYSEENNSDGNKRGYIFKYVDGPGPQKETLTNKDESHPSTYPQSIAVSAGEVWVGGYYQDEAWRWPDETAQNAAVLWKSPLTGISNQKTTLLP
ncbi:BACON domain-containing protein, partial [Alistipes sp. OttesenSCG-928-B03]|nr:BACON domain-containing protein [Alistipes sp. OttesenSCG-928-B03]